MGLRLFVPVLHSLGSRAEAMRVFSTLLLSLTVLATSLLALAADGTQKQEYQVRVMSAEGRSVVSYPRRAM